MNDDTLKNLEIPPKLQEHLNLMKKVMDSDYYKTAFDMVSKYDNLKPTIEYIKQIKPSLELVKDIPSEYLKLNEITKKFFNQIPTSTNNGTDRVNNDTPTTHDVDEFFETVEKIVPQIDDEECRNEVQQLVTDARKEYKFFDWDQVTMTKVIPWIIAIVALINAIYHS
ncbi:hypothetical protein J2W97_001182 [Paenibacillus jamilae]|nr:hypothetical protein [Paenibacillus jamilae]